MRAPVLTFKRARTLRKMMTLPEVLLWQAVRGRRLNGLAFRRQHPIGSYVLDFYCPAARLAVEVDGKIHETPAQIEHDFRREQWLSKRGIKVLRIGAADILKENNMESVLDCIAEAAAPSTASRSPSPATQGRNAPSTASQGKSAPSVLALARQSTSPATQGRNAPSVSRVISARHLPRYAGEE